MKRFISIGVLGMIALAIGAGSLYAGNEVKQPVIDGPWWTVAGDPDLGEFTSPKQQPVDFAVWQAADGTWQLWSCIRHTKCGGMTRLFHRWECKQLTDADWQPMGIAMQADPTHGETPGGLQAPHVVKEGDKYLMFYGDWEHICLAESRDGKKFERVVQPSGHTGMFGEGLNSNTRDPMALKIGDQWHCYYTAHPQLKGADYCRTSRDLKQWSEATKVAFGGGAGTGPGSAECPFVVELDGRYYLFRTQRYGQNAQTSIYHSRDPMDFGRDNDAGHFIDTLPVAAPEIIVHDGQYYIAALRPDLKGIQIARLKWVAHAQSGAKANDARSSQE
jgi:hypothetical protein